jgi:glucose/arabinose dehydrogenase
MNNPQMLTNLRRPLFVTVGMLILLLGFAAQIMAEELGPGSGTIVQPSQLRLVEVVGGLESPVFLTHAGDDSGRLFVVERPGRIRIVKDGALLPAPFLDISNKVSTRGECGLLSVAFAPDYAESGAFYIYYSYDVAELGDLVGPDVPGEPNGGCDSVIARIIVSENPDVADPASEESVLVVNQPYLNHNGGQINFGPDGYLYIGLGDGGAGGDPHFLARNPASLLGKMLRIDVTGQETYAVPADNPFVGVEGYRPEIWALGLRNPWRHSFDRETGDLYIGDVGQSAVEEIDFQPAASGGGEDYGWNIVEGDRCYLDEDCDQTGLTPPVFTYDHEQPNCGGSVTGGYVFRGDTASPLYGVYVFGEFCLRQIWAIYPPANHGATAGDATQDWTGGPLLDVGFNVMSFGEDEAGNLYVMGTDNGVYRIVAFNQDVYLPNVRRQ